MFHRPAIAAGCVPRPSPQAAAAGCFPRPCPQAASCCPCPVRPQLCSWTATVGDPIASICGYYGCSLVVDATVVARVKS